VITLDDNTDVITSLDDLKERAKKGPVHAAILLAGGLAFSRKTIVRLRNGKWRVKNHIDDTSQLLTDDELWTESNIGLAIDRGALVVMP